MIQTEAMLGLQKNKEKHTFQNFFIIQTILYSIQKNFWKILYSELKHALIN